MSKMTYDDWVEKFEPEQDGPVDWELLPQPIKPGCIWTLVETDEGNYIVDGPHYVNRLGHFTTKDPFEGDHLEVLDD